MIIFVGFPTEGIQLHHFPSTFLDGYWCAILGLLMKKGMNILNIDVGAVAAAA
jgi:hypothetical protein